tara:strand:- start:32045 stop:32404 length:360 start_codon:yes stop_codon:yes gene_type:complete
MAEHNEFGKLGEQLAVDYLVKNGYIIRYKNYRYLKAEIDIIAQKADALIVVEVKARTTDFIADIGDLISHKKIKLLVLAADHYILANAIDLEVRFDIITVFKVKDKYNLEHIENAFYHF